MWTIIVVCLIIGVIGMIKTIFFGYDYESAGKKREREKREEWEYNKKVEEGSKLPLREIWRQFLSSEFRIEEKKILISVMEMKQGVDFSEWEVIYSQNRLKVEAMEKTITERINSISFSYDEGSSHQVYKALRAWVEQLRRLEAIVIEKMVGLAKTFSEWKYILSVCKYHVRGKVIGAMFGLAETFDEWEYILSVCGDSGRVLVLKKMVETATSYNDWSTIAKATYKPYPYDNGPDRPIWDLA